MDGVVERTTGWTPEQLDLIKRTVADGTTDDEFAMFMHYCQQSGLDPLRKQAHCIVRDYTDKRGQHIFWDAHRRWFLRVIISASTTVRT